MYICIVIWNMVVLTIIIFIIKSPHIDMPNVATLTLGSQPRQRVRKLRVKMETRESHHMLRVQKMWRNEPSHSQVNSHYGSWSSKWTFESSNRNSRGQTHQLEKFFITLKSYWNINVKNGLASFIWTSETQVMVKRKAGNQIGSLTFDH
jgi:hypothetical protein